MSAQKEYRTPWETITWLRGHIRPEWRTAFWSAFLLGLLTHMPILLSDIPNHDGLGSIYFDQNMITSGRWFLMVACGFSSFYTLPWVIGLIGIFWLSCAGVVLTEILRLKDRLVIGLVSGLLVTFPALASTFAYVFTLDGYMMALFLAVLAVFLAGRPRFGFVAGAVCLAFSMGIYQAYLPFAILLSLYSAVLLAVEEGTVREKARGILRYAGMGIFGAALYYGILRVLLWLQGKELASYQGIDGMESVGSRGLLSSLAHMYRDFFSFTFKGNVLFHNPFSIAALAVLVLLTAAAVIRMAFFRKWWKKPIFFVIIGLLVIGCPLATNVILAISPEVTYHLLMRYQWILYPILMLAFVSRYGGGGRSGALCSWALVLSGAVMVFCYLVTDNIAYSNLEKRYEKTYAYCVRLLDRIEQTEGYYQGIPIAIVGVVGSDPYPLTDITQDVTSGMIGISGDQDLLLYTGANYQAFMKNYLGATLNFLSPEETGRIYYSEEYIDMESFPGETSVKVIDGVLCVKTENTGRD